MAARHQAYPEYQKAIVDWMGEVPAGWDIKPCRSIVQNMEKKNEGALDQNYLSLMANVGVILYEDKGDVGNKKPDDLSKCKIVIKGNLVINSMNYSIGSYGMSEYDGVCSPVYIVLDPDINVVHSRFALRIFENSPFQKYLATFGNGILAHRAAIGWDDIKAAYIPVPPKEEQLYILDFLDHEIAKIDTLINKQQQLIKLLKEKRQAVISHAVTKGLNPATPMKDSGVEWFGEVPEHWVVTKFSYVALIVRGGSPRPAGDPTLFNGDYSPWVTVGEITKDDDIYLTETETFLTQKGSEQCRVFSPDTLLLTNSGGTLGVPKILRISANANDGVIGFENLLLNREFTYFYLSTLTEKLRDQIRNKGGSTQINLNTDIVKNISVPLPPKEEIESIVAYLFDRIDKYKRLETNAEAGIKLLQERRTALISAAVTGKIDVRNWQPVQPKIPMGVK